MALARGQWSGRRQYSSKHTSAFSPRDAPELLLQSLARRGSRECRVPNAPAVSCAKVESTRGSHHEFTGITRHSRTRWFYSLLRALLGDRACLPPSPAESLPPT